jgi:hypothetical protein
LRGQERATEPESNHECDGAADEAQRVYHDDRDIAKAQAVKQPDCIAADVGREEAC